MKEAEHGFGKALVVFIDILGSRGRTNFDELYNINNIFHTELEKNSKNDKKHTVYERTIHTFSDCSYIIYDFKENVDESRKKLGSLFEVALCNLEPLLCQFLAKGFLFRGGVVYDDVYYEKNRSLLFGPAINRAYELESKKAIYPRILLDDFVAKQVISTWEKERDESDLLKFSMPELYAEIGNIKENIEGIVAIKDKDDYYIHNYLRAFGKDVSMEGLINKSNQEFLLECIEMCETNIKKYKFINNNISLKYEWLYYYIFSVVTDENDMKCFHDIMNIENQNTF